MPDAQHADSRPLLKNSAMMRNEGLNWVAVKEVNLSYCIGETILITIYIYP